jgi:hypothetical protein
MPSCAKNLFSLRFGAAICVTQNAADHFRAITIRDNASPQRKNHDFFVKTAKPV